MVERTSLRERNRLITMELVQNTAVQLFEESGFAEVTVEDVAAASGVSPSTIFRHFGTKENLVLWDVRDAVVDEHLADGLARDDPTSAFRNAVISGLAERNDGKEYLRRLRLTYSEPAKWAVAALQDRKNREDLAEAIARFAGRRQAALADEAIAATCLAALDVALNAWQRGNGRERLPDLISSAIAAATGSD